MRWRRKTVSQFSGERLYYMRDSRPNAIVGNCIMWWRKGGSGYTCNLDNAEVYTESKAIEMHKSRETDRPYPKDIIDSMAYRHVDHQNIIHLEYEEIAPQESGAEPVQCLTNKGQNTGSPVGN